MNKDYLLKRIVHREDTLQGIRTHEIYQTTSATWVRNQASWVITEAPIPTWTTQTKIRSQDKTRLQIRRCTTLARAALVMPTSHRVPPRMLFKGILTLATSCRVFSSRWLFRRKHFQPTQQLQVVTSEAHRVGCRRRGISATTQSWLTSTRIRLCLTFRISNSQLLD
jgi:hypothetical protein